jgi:hypothetical protein
MSDDFNLNGPEEVPEFSGPSMCLNVPCVNAPEHELQAMLHMESLLPCDPIFADADGQEWAFGDDGKPERVVTANFRQDDPAMSAIRQKISDAWLRHIQLARSLGENVTWSDYVKACEREHMTPMPRRHT